jgi:fatty acid CoA ligase FadD36
MGDLLPALDGRFGDRPQAVTVAGQSLSWSALAQRAASLRGALAGRGALAVDATATLETVVEVVAAIEAGVTVVPVPPDAGPMERDHILGDSGAAFLADPPGPASAGPAMVVYTSGTTGLPKGVALSAASIAAGLDGLAEAWQWTADDTLVHGLPLFHVHGLILGVLGALRHGSTLVHTGRPTAAAYAAARGSLYFGVPTVWSRVCDSPNEARALRGARLLVSGSAPLPVPVFDRLASLTGHAPVERYGMTETLITLSTRAGGERRPGWVGVPIARVETRLVDDGGAPVGRDGVTVGELQVRGATLFDGYLGRPEATAAAYDGDWFRTGDAAVIDAGGFHRIVGRQSIDVIKTGGFKVGAGEVEAALLGFPGVREVAVVGEPDDDLGQRVVAYVVGDGVDEAGAIAHVAAELSVHKRPRAVRRVDALPRNAMGKVQKHLLR